jgi:SEFIR domain/N-6 DNA Methylase
VDSQGGSTSRRQQKLPGNPVDRRANAFSIPPPVRVFISYAHDNAQHEAHVRQLWLFLRRQGIDAVLDLSVAQRRQDWPTWMLRQIRLARFVLVIASPAYRRRAEGEARPDEGRGVQWEAMLIREEMYGDQDAALNRFLPVVLPGCSADDIPEWMGPTTTTHYVIVDYTIQGAESLLRVLTGQPSELVPPLGSTPVLPPQAPRLSESTGEAVRRALLRRLADRSGERNEAMVQADVRQLLLIGSLGIGENELGAAETQVEDRRRIYIDRAHIVIKVSRDLRAPGVVTTAERQLDRYLAARQQQTGERYIAVLTDGADWRLYIRIDDQLKQAAMLLVDSSAPAADKMIIWLEAVLATARKLKPRPEEIARKLGADSPAHALDIAELTSIYCKHRDLPTVKLKRGMWAKLLTTAQGTVFSNEDSLFIDHTLLVLMAEVIGHAVLGLRPDDPAVSAQAIVTGTMFSEKALIGGVVEADFFDWIVEVPSGPEFVKDLARRLTRFAWDQVEHDVLKVLYQSIISQETRKRLGEYYTPDWLAEAIVNESVGDPLNQRVLDASCGSGTFLFHVVRRYLTAADDAGLPNSDIFGNLVRQVTDIDVHPVACTLARVTYLLAIGTKRLRARDRPAFTVPVYLGDSLRWGQEAQTIFSYEGLSVPTADNREIFVNDTELTDDKEFTDQLKFPKQVVSDVYKFDLLVAELAERATQRERFTEPPPLTPVFERFEISSDDRPVLQQTFRNMCRLHDHGKDHIWGYYVRNLARPVWLSRPDNRIDVLVGNPPWLSYRYMTERQQAAFREMSIKRELWTGGTTAPSQDLSALFVVRCVEQYLRVGGNFAYVMPWGVLSRRQYVGFRAGSYPSHAGVREGCIRPAMGSSHGQAQLLLGACQRCFRPALLSPARTSSVDAVAGVVVRTAYQPQPIPITVHRVVYSASGMYLAAAVVTDPNAIIEHKLYWAPTDSREEASFLSAILNSTSLTNAVRPLQARGEHNPRDFDKYIFHLPIPPYDPRDKSHQELVALAEQAARIADTVELPTTRFETQRRKIRETLTTSGLLPEVDAVVKRLLT